MAQIEDYLLRQIKRFAAAIRAVIRAREEEPEAEMEAIADGLRGLVGGTVDTLARMPPAALRPLFLDGDRIEADKAIAVAWLLDAAARLQADPSAAYRLRVAAVGIHTLALEQAPPGQPSADLDERVRRVHLRRLGASTLATLLRHYEALDRFDRAEDIVFAWIEVDRDPGLAAGRGLYEHLWSLPDARLRAGGLSSQEVLEGLAELEQKAGSER